MFLQWNLLNFVWSLQENGRRNYFHLRTIQVHLHLGSKREAKNLGRRDHEYGSGTSSGSLYSWFLNDIPLYHTRLCPHYQLLYVDSCLTWILCHQLRGRYGDSDDYLHDTRGGKNTSRGPPVSVRLGSLVSLLYRQGRRFCPSATYITGRTKGHISVSVTGTNLWHTRSTSRLSNYSNRVIIQGCYQNSYSK